jgi:thiamine pyrophosphate-dependent acetolactate synthase large subunit-like protein
VSDLLAADGHFDRRRLVKAVLDKRGDALVVGGLGASTWDITAAGLDDRNVYLWGGMGLACSIGLGLALAQPSRRVLVITGDGEMMMGIGSLATIAAAAPDNLAVLVLDNQAFGETGRQTGLTAGPTDIARMAEGAGIDAAMTVTSPKNLPALEALIYEKAGPTLAVAKVALTDDPLVLPTNDGALMAGRFREALGLSDRN